VEATFMTRAEKIAHNKAEKQIDEVYSKYCCNVPIPMLEIPNVFKVGHKALSEGNDLRTAIIEFVETIRTDKPKPIERGMGVVVIAG
jgi:hypothetical protein